MASRLKRYDANKRGSFQISLDFYDWELSIVIGALRSIRKDHEKLEKSSKGYLTYLKRLESKFSEALGNVLRAEFQDLKLTTTKQLLEGNEQGDVCQNRETCQEYYGKDFECPPNCQLRWRG